MYTRSRSILRLLVAGFAVELTIMSISIAFMCAPPLSLIYHRRNSRNDQVYTLITFNMYGDRGSDYSPALWVRCFL